MYRSAVESFDSMEVVDSPSSYSTVETPSTEIRQNTPKSCQDSLKKAVTVSSVCGSDSSQ